MGAGEELRLAAFGRKYQRRLATIGGHFEALTDAGIEVAYRVAFWALGGGAGPLQRMFTQSRIAGAANVITGLGVPGVFDFFEYLGGAAVAEGLCIAHGAGHAGDYLPVCQGVAWRLYGLLHQGQIALGVDHHSLGFGP
ncbi:hypothetical protein D3C73_1117830 [compost metagenome]